MKKDIIIVCFLLSLALSSCKEKLAPYEADLNSIKYSSSDTIKNFSFCYHNSNATLDTISVTVATIGYVTNEPRSFTVKQIPTGNIYNKEGVVTTVREDAEAGKHFISLDDPEIKKTFIIKPNKNYATINIVLKRDPSLLDKTFFLKLRLIPNDNFNVPFDNSRDFIISTTEQYVKPASWNWTFSWFFYGDFGAEKHKFFVKVMREQLGINPDEEWFRLLKPFDDLGLTAFYANVLTEELIKYNKERVENKLDILREKPVDEEINGKIVRFRSYGKDLPYL